MLVCFFDHKGIVHYEFTAQGQTVNQQLYLEVLTSLRESVRRKRRRLWPDKWILHHDSAPVHDALSYVTVIKLNYGRYNIKWSWINSLKYHYSSTLCQSTLNACVSSWHSFWFPCQGKSNFFPCQQHFSSVPKPCHIHSVYHETPLKLSKQLSTSLTKAAVDRHLLSNLPAVNIRMIQIPFTIHY
jgi:hypothetical protein